MNVLVTDEQSEPVDRDHLQDLAARVLAAERCPDGASVAVTLVTDEVIAGYNREFMGREGPTDVLAFPIEDLIAGRPPAADPDGPPLLLGDVVIAPGQVRAQAAEQGVDFDTELSLMVVHGILHLLGYDHVEDGEAERMEDRERSILAEVGMVRA